MPKVTKLLWAKKVMLWCRAVMGRWLKDGWVGAPPYFIAHTDAIPHHHSTSASFLSLPGPVVWRDALCSQVCCRGRGWQAHYSTLSGMPSVKGMRASPRSGNSTGTLPQLLPVRECGGNCRERSSSLSEIIADRDPRQSAQFTYPCVPV